MKSPSGAGLERGTAAKKWQTLAVTLRKVSRGGYRGSRGTEEAENTAENTDVLAEIAETDFLRALRELCELRGSKLVIAGKGPLWPVS